MQHVRDALVQERGRLQAGLAGVPYLEPFPSSANFVLCRVGGGRDAKQLKDALAQRHGIMVCDSWGAMFWAADCARSVNSLQHTHALPASCLQDKRADST